MQYAPPSAATKRGGLGPSPARRNLLWESTRARSQAHAEPVTVAARDGKRGPLVECHGLFSAEAAAVAIGAYRGALNRAACRNGHVLVRKYRAARAAEQTLPVPGPLSSGPVFCVGAERKEAVAPAAVHHGSALDAILAVHARCVSLARI